jgi:hypothetical protein
MGRGMPIGNPAVGRGWWRGFPRLSPPADRPGAAPVFAMLFRLTGAGRPGAAGNFPKLFVLAVKLAARCLAVGLATPAAASPAAGGLLTRGPEPVNLLVMGLALAVLFIFRRFRNLS